MAHSLWSDRPLGVRLAALVAAGAQATIDDEAARMATSPHSSVAIFRY
jgi:hypothetical protein